MVAAADLAGSTNATALVKHKKSLTSASAYSYTNLGKLAKLLEYTVMAQASEDPKLLLSSKELIRHNQ